MITYTATPDYYNEYISHHGIIGQSWGHRNGPPYPLDSSKSTGNRLKSKGSVSKKTGVKKSAVKKARKDYEKTHRLFETSDGRSWYVGKNLWNQPEYKGEFRYPSHSVKQKNGHYYQYTIDRKYNIPVSMYEMTRSGNIIKGSSKLLDYNDIVKLKDFPDYSVKRRKKT